MRAPRAVVVGVGNVFRRDDGIGPALAAELNARQLPGVSVVLSDGEPSHLLDTWSDIELAIVVDAVRCEPSTPGRIHRITGAEYLTTASASTHGLGIPEAMRLAEALGHAPQQLIVFAVEAAELGFGPGLSPALVQALPELTRAVLSELDAVAGTTPPRCERLG